MVGDIPQPGTEENETLTAPFTEKEVFEAIPRMKNNKAPRPDGLPAEFYKICWPIIKGDLLPMFDDLFNGHMQLFYLNFGTITFCQRRDGAH